MRTRNTTLTTTMVVPIPLGFSKFGTTPGGGLRAGIFDKSGYLEGSITGLWRPAVRITRPTQNPVQCVEYRIEVMTKRINRMESGGVSKLTNVVHSAPLSEPLMSLNNVISALIVSRGWALSQSISSLGYFTVMLVYRMK